ncbi:MAG: hypothetical protein DHS80DRAFT_21038 [Piptocephalis tieghemiana]|nr:MAG: hypothetical protein DHS80DRAFT_21038 [Piptocephalis tieghemiana]
MAQCESSDLLVRVGLAPRARDPYTDSMHKIYGEKAINYLPMFRAPISLWLHIHEEKSDKGKDTKCVCVQSSSATLLFQFAESTSTTEPVKASRTCKKKDYVTKNTSRKVDKDARARKIRGRGGTSQSLDPRANVHNNNNNNASFSSSSRGSTLPSPHEALIRAKERQMKIKERWPERRRGRGRDPFLADPDALCGSSIPLTRSQHQILEQFYAALSKKDTQNASIVAFHGLRRLGLERSSTISPSRQVRGRIEEDDLLQELNGVLGILSMRGKLEAREVRRVLRWVYTVFNPYFPKRGYHDVPSSFSWLWNAPLDPVAQHILLLYARPHLSPLEFALIVERSIKGLEASKEGLTDPHYYTLAMDAWLRAGNPTKVWDTYQRMLNAGHPLHYSSVHLLLRLLRSLGASIHDMERVWRGVGRQYQDPSGWSILFKACVALADVKAMTRLVHQARTRGWEVRPHLTSQEALELSYIPLNTNKTLTEGEDRKSMQGTCQDEVERGVGFLDAPDHACIITPG